MRKLLPRATKLLIYIVLATMTFIVSLLGSTNGKISFVARTAYADAPTDTGGGWVPIAVDTGCMCTGDSDGSGDGCACSGDGCSGGDSP